LRGAPLLSAYRASKFAATGLIEVASPESAVRGIRINDLCLVRVGTPMQERELGWHAKGLGITPAEMLVGYETSTRSGQVAEPQNVSFPARR
jgi:NAD(P)-dependent dehydrogenase (short-subunit alcohol dehydrogenase family)